MTGVWLTDNPQCPRCGLTLHVDDPAEGYQEVPSGPMKLRHALDRHGQGRLCRCPQPSRVDAQ